MRTTLRMMTLGTALSVATIAVLPMMGSTMGGGQDQDHHEYAREQSHPEYSSNPYYRVGNNEGYEDHKRKVQRKEHHHKYHSDDDRKAHDYGYQQGWQGQHYAGDHDHDNH